MLIAIANEGGVSVSWLAAGNEAAGVPTGESLSRVAVDPKLLAQVIEGVETGLDSLEMTLDRGKKAELICLLYEHFQDQGQVVPETVHRFIRLAS